jgi:hypothetical protein
MINGHISPMRCVSAAPLLRQRSFAGIPIWCGADMLGGMQFRFVEDWQLVDRIEDWSGVRSPARARRRRRRGFPQRIKVFEVPKPEVYQAPGGMIIGHPVTIAKLKEQIRAQTLASSLHR